MVISSSLNFPVSSDIGGVSLSAGGCRTVSGICWITRHNDRSFNLYASVVRSGFRRLLEGFCCVFPYNFDELILFSEKKITVWRVFLYIYLLVLQLSATLLDLYCLGLIILSPTTKMSAHTKNKNNKIIKSNKQGHISCVFAAMKSILELLFGAFFLKKIDLVKSAAQPSFPLFFFFTFFCLWNINHIFLY